MFPRRTRMCIFFLLLLLHRFNSDGACSAPPFLNHKLAQLQQNRTEHVNTVPFKIMDCPTLNQPHECCSDHAAPLPEMRSQRLTASTHPLQRTVHHTSQKSSRYAISARDKTISKYIRTYYVNRGLYFQPTTC